MSARVHGTIKQKTYWRKVRRDVAPGRRTRHGKAIISLEEAVKMGQRYDPSTMGIRRQEIVKIAAGPTQMKGKLNLPPVMEGGRRRQPDPTPEWWKEYLR